MGGTGGGFKDRMLLPFPIPLWGGGQVTILHFT